MPSWTPRRLSLREDLARERIRLENAKFEELAPRVPIERSEPVEITPKVEPFPNIQKLTEPLPRIALTPIEPLSPFETRKTEFELPESRFTPKLESREIPKEQTISMPSKKIDQPEWWEQPKVLAENVMEKVGEGITKVPVLPKVLEFIAPAFNFIHRKLEKPWSAIITSPWSPTLPWKTGESWADHEKREYASWNAPTYIKGAAEFSMPLWWFPWFKLVKGARALGVGDKAARASAEVAKKAGSKIAIPSKQAINDSIYKGDFFKSIALWAEGKPILNGVVKALGGPSAFVRDVGEVFPAMDVATRKLVVVNSRSVRVPVTDVVNREIVSRAVLGDMAQGYKGLQLPRMQKFGDVQKILQVDDTGRVLSATPIGVEGRQLGRGLSEVFENPELYTYASANAKTIVTEGNAILKELFETAGEEGVRKSKGITFHRLVEGKFDDVLEEFEKSEFGSLFEVARKYKTMEQGAKAVSLGGGGIKYGTDPIKSIGATIDHYFKKIAAKRFNDEIRKLGLTVPEMVGLIEPTLLSRMASLGTRAGSASFAIKNMKRLTSFAGKRIPPATMAKIRRGLPEIADRLDGMFAILPKDIDGVISGLSREFWKATKLSPTQFKVLFANAEGKTFVQKIENTILQQNLASKTSTEAIEKIYKNAYKLNKGRVDDTLKSIHKEADTILGGAKAELKPLKQQYNSLASRFNSRQIFGNLAKFQRHGAYGNRIFDANVVKIVEKHFAPQGTKWVKDMAIISGTGRMLIAAMDFSAPFIQGLAVLGANPIAWAKGVGKQFGFFMNPTNLYRYLDDPVVRAVAQERWFFGGSRSTFEYFDALKPLQNLVSKTPIVGKYGQRVIGQTYGRAEAAFTGFGEVARNEMWKALRKPGMADAELRGLARTIDRMTGVMSTEALAIGRAQQDFENAFVFFAPRYTRAGMSYVADVMKGGLTGAQARKSLGSLMAGGMSMYYGITTVLGQQPNLDPTSAKFLTVKIGDDFVGIGGILYSLARFGSNVLATAADEEERGLLSPLNFSRTDNPFYKFMFNRASPLTGLTVGAVVEQKNFFGEPLEDVGDWARFVAEKVLPIALQRAVLEPEHRNPVVFASELMGGRTFPKSPWALQEDAQEAVANDKFQLPYDRLDLLKKREVDRDPEVSKYQEEIDQSTTNRGKALSVAFLERRRDMEDARFMHQNSIEGFQKAFDEGLIDGYQFRQFVADAGTGLGATIEHINGRERYKDAMEKLKEPKDVSREYRWELVYDELIEATYGDGAMLNGQRVQLTDEFGIFNYDLYNEFIEDLIARYSKEDFAKAKQMQADKYKDYPPLFQELQQAKEIMKPYWEVQKEVERLFGKRFAESSRGKSLISKRRKLLRRQNPDVERAFQQFYART